MNYWKNFKNENKGIWHFDPMKKSNDSIYVGNLNADFSKFISISKNLKYFKKIVVAENFKSSNKDVTKRIKEFRKWGFNEHNTISYQCFDDDYPKFFEKFNTVSNLINSTSYLIRQDPGQSLPWHYDTFIGYMKKYGVNSDKKIARYIVMVEDWDWGHYLLIGNSVLHQWKKGDIYLIPYRMHHTSVCAGMKPKLTLIITGTTQKNSLHKLKSKNFKI
tara:strand:+ start:458 stop:1111 length:654 start_codon:yes stop_codon:yes gene_type:complete